MRINTDAITFFFPHDPKGFELVSKGRKRDLLRRLIFYSFPEMDVKELERLLNRASRKCAKPTKDQELADILASEVDDKTVEAFNALGDLDPEAQADMDQVAVQQVLIFQLMAIWMHFNYYDLYHYYYYHCYYYCYYYYYY